MRNLYLSLLVFLACALNANASTKILVNQNFESATSVPDGWGSLSMAATLAIGGDDYGKYLSFSPTGNDRSCQFIWGSVLNNDAPTEYTVEFSICANKWGTNHTTNEYTIFTDPDAATTLTKKGNGNYRSSSYGEWIFDLTQLATNSAAASGDQIFCLNGDSTNTIALSSGTWYVVTIKVNTEAKSADYAITSTTGEEVASGSYTFTGDNVYATGLYFLGARYYPVQYFDDIKVSYESDEEIANNPVVALTGINNQQRVYSITFVDGETLHYQFGSQEEQEVMYADCDGVFTWSNNPNYNPDHEGPLEDQCDAGTLTVWTTNGDATSEKIEVEVSNTIVTLPAATATISAVEEGYTKTYTVTADNSTVDLQPTLTIQASFTAEDGTVTNWTDLASGSKVTVPSKGTLTLTTQAYGYGETTTTVENNIEYAQSKDYNIAHWTEEEITALGFAADGNVTGNYSTYGRLYGYNSATYDATLEDLTKNEKITYTTIPQYTKKSSEWTDGVITEGLKFTDTPSVSVHIYKGVGMVLEGRKGDDQSGNWISSLYLTVEGLTSNQFIVASSLSNYGSSSLHPVVADEAAYLACNNAPVTAVIAGDDATGVGLYRISDCLARIQVFSAKGTEGIQDVNIVDEKANENAPVYTIGGVQVNKANLQKGIYIQNGKKFVVK